MRIFDTIMTTPFLDALIRLLWKIGILASIFIFILAIVLYIKQESLLYFPSIGGVPRRPSQNPRRYRSPSEHGIPFETHLIPCADGTAIHSWLLYHPATDNDHDESDDDETRNNHQRQTGGRRHQPATPAKPIITRPTIIFFHGNAGNIGLRLPNAIQMYHTLNVHVWLIEYRGYGDSDDVPPNEMGLKMDAEAVWDHVHAIQSRAKVVGSASDGNQKEVVVVVGHDGSRNTRRSFSSSALLTIIDPRKMIVFGQSLGGAVAFHLAQYAQSKITSSTAPPSSSDITSKSSHDYPPRLAGIIVENTFLSISKMVDHLMPYLSPIKLFVLRMQWNTEHVVSSIRVPTLFMAGKLDTLVPHFHMLTLYERMTRTTITRTTMKGNDNGNNNNHHQPLVRLHVVENGTHNETWMQGGREYWRAMRQFLEEVFAYEIPEGIIGLAAEVGVVGNNRDTLLNAVGAEGSSRNSIVGRGCGVNDGPFLRKASAASSSAECLPPQHLLGSMMTTSHTDSKTSSTTTLRKDTVEIELGGEDAADMISSVNSILGMAREAATRTVGVAVKGGGPSTAGAETSYKKKD